MSYTPKAREFQSSLINSPSARSKWSSLDESNAPPFLVQTERTSALRTSRKGTCRRRPHPVPEIIESSPASTRTVVPPSLNQKATNITMGNPTKIPKNAK